MNSRRVIIEVVDDDMAAVLREKTPAQRLAATHAMWRCAFDRINMLLRRQHPDWEPQRIRAEVRRRMLGSSGPA
jgi:hypothetical protein